ncbi:SWIM zinc finger family protein [Plantactinospora sonchi]|uniref:SWIM zinc finger family protein n=1 Tax=Plantactinospora sonchi TaxID=1544735 RepID=A0ABU7RU47_9ACTN
MNGHDDRVRGFAAFPPGRRVRAGRSWWGDAWIRALEDTSLDQTLLRRGRRYAGAGHVGPITVSPGRVAADVHDGDEEILYRTRVFVEPLTDAQWDRFCDQVAVKAGHLAALLDREMPRELVVAADDVGVPLLPGVGELQPECDCPEWGHPCRHGAALCYQVAWLLDADPFLLLLIRGRGERELLAGLRQRTARVAAVEADTASAPAGVPAEQVFNRPDPPPPSVRIDLPEPVGAPPTLPDGPGIAAWSLRVLVDNAAARATMLLDLVDRSDPNTDVGGPVVPVDEWSDAVRLAASGADGPTLARLRRAVDRPGRDFDRAVRAWECGGRTGLAVLTGSWRPAPPVLARARVRLRAGWVGDEVPQPRVWRNRWTFPDRQAQLRYGPDGRWYPYRERADGWWPAGPPRVDPVEVLADLFGE